MSFGTSPTPSCTANGQIELNPKEVDPTGIENTPKVDPSFTQEGIKWTKVIHVI